MSRYICDDCGSIFYDPNEKEMYGEIHDCCPMCESVNIKQDWSYVERAEALERANLELEEIKDRLTDIQVHIRHRLNTLGAELKFNDINDELTKRCNDIIRVKDNLKGYDSNDN